MRRAHQCRRRVYLQVFAWSLFDHVAGCPFIVPSFTSTPGGWTDGLMMMGNSGKVIHICCCWLTEWLAPPLVINKILRVVQLSLGPKWWNQNRRNAIIIFLRAFGPGRSTRASLKLLSSQKGSQLFKQMLFTYVHRYFSVTEIGAFPKISSSPLTIFLYI